MEIKLRTVWALYFSVMYNFVAIINSHQYMDVINHLIEYVKDNHRENQVMLMKISQEYSFPQALFIQHFGNEFPSLVVHINEVINAFRNESSILSLRLNELLENKALNVIFVNGEDEEIAIQELAQYVHQFQCSLQGQV